MITRLKIAISQEEYSALLKLASDELRNPSDQAHQIIRDVLQKRGFLYDANDDSPLDAKQNQHVNEQ